MLNSRQRNQYFKSQFYSKLGERLFCDSCGHSDYDIQAKFADINNPENTSDSIENSDYDLCFVMKCKKCKKRKFIFLSSL